MEIIVQYDDRDVSRSSAYFGCLNKYDAVGMGHSDGTCSMFMSVRNFDRKRLTTDLGDIQIVAIRQ